MKSLPEFNFHGLCDRFALLCLKTAIKENLSLMTTKVFLVKEEMCEESGLRELVVIYLVYYNWKKKIQTHTHTQQSKMRPYWNL